MNNPKIVIINYGMGNLQSVKKAFERVGANVVIDDDPDSIAKADKIVLPGVGNFEMGMNKLNTSGIKDLLNELVLVKKKPILGICLGMQLFTSFSEEGNIKGLNWIEGKTEYFGKLETKGRQLAVPHMGWNDLQIKNPHVILNGVPDMSTFYFVHSYAVQCTHPENVVAGSTYGKSFASVISKENIIGTQFHPEKSHSPGLLLLENFVKNC